MRVSNELLRRCLEECDRGAECSLWRMVGLADVLHDLEDARSAEGYQRDERDKAREKTEAMRADVERLGRAIEALRGERDEEQARNRTMLASCDRLRHERDAERKRADHEKRRADRYCKSGDRGYARALRFEKALRKLKACLTDDHPAYYARTIIAAALRPDAEKKGGERRCVTCASRYTPHDAAPCLYCYEHDDHPSWHNPTPATPLPTVADVAGCAPHAAKAYGEDVPFSMKLDHEGRIIAASPHVHCGLCGEVALYVGGVGGAFGGLKEKHYRCLACGSSGKHHGGDAWVSWMAGTEDSASSLYRTNVKEGEG